MAEKQVRFGLFIEYLLGSSGGVSELVSWRSTPPYISDGEVTITNYRKSQVISSFDAHLRWVRDELRRIVADGHSIQPPLRWLEDALGRRYWSVDVEDARQALKRVAQCLTPDADIASKVEAIRDTQSMVRAVVAPFAPRKLLPDNYFAQMLLDHEGFYPHHPFSVEDLDREGSFRQYLKKLSMAEVSWCAASFVKTVKEIEQVIRFQFDRDLLSSGWESYRRQAIGDAVSGWWKQMLAVDDFFSLSWCQSHFPPDVVYWEVEEAFDQAYNAQVEADD